MSKQNNVGAGPVSARNKQKGITLIALIITIIVMLILVGVTVSVSLNGGLFSKAKEAGSDYETEAAKEAGILNEPIEIDGQLYATYEDYINNNPLVETYSWKQDGNEIKYISESGKVKTTLMIGDKVDYDEGTDTSVTAYDYWQEKTYTINGENDTVALGDLEWRVLGVTSNGKIELLSTTSTLTTVSSYGDVRDYSWAYSLYSEGYGAYSVRGLCASDINKLTGYDPETMYDGYGTEYVYKYFDNSNRW